MQPGRNGICIIEVTPRDCGFRRKRNFHDDALDYSGIFHSMDYRYLDNRLGIMTILLVTLCSFLALPGFGMAWKCQRLLLLLLLLLRLIIHEGRL
jgi:hypothetical protein